MRFPRLPHHRSAAPHRVRLAVAIGLLLASLGAAGIARSAGYPVIDIEAIKQRVQQQQSQRAYEKALKAADKAKKNALDLAFKRALTTFLTNVAQQTAVYISNVVTGTRQKPFWKSDPAYFSNLLDATAGDFLDSLGTDVFGIDVCSQADSRKQYSLATAVRQLVDPANWCQRSCDQQMKQANTADTFQVGVGVISPLTDAIGPPGGIALTLPQAEMNVKALRDTLNLAQCEDVYSAEDCPAQGTDALSACGQLPVSLGDCLDAYSRDIAAYKQAVGQKHGACVQLCNVEKRVARCTASDAIKNVKNQKEADLLPEFSKYIQPGENDISQLLILPQKAEEAKDQALEAERIAKEGFSGLVDKLTGKVKTPAPLVEEAATQNLAQDTSSKIFSLQTGSPAADAIAVFERTLTSRLLKRIFEKGFTASTGISGFGSNGAFLAGGSSVQAARTLYADIAQPDFGPSSSSFSLTDLTACPDADRTQNSCVMDDNFRQAVEQGMTVQEALAAGLLRANRLFGFSSTTQPGRPATQPDVPEDGYSYRSMLILRRLRILPVGWELAAQYIRDFGTRLYTLQDVVDGFSQCGQNATPASPFCGLVDPNWVLKIPETVCRVQAPTAQVMSTDDVSEEGAPVTSIQRAEECVDQKGCLQEDEQGNCLSYGYCVQERPSWKFGGDQCTNYYQSCEAFADRNGIQTAYLKNTLNAEGCSATNAGCQWYCQDLVNGAYTCSDTSGYKDYFTAAVKTCPADAAGCTEYIRTGKNSNLAPNGGFEQIASGDLADDSTNDAFTGWLTENAATQAVSDAFDGSQALSLSGAGAEVRSEFVAAPLSSFLEGRSYTLSVYAKSPSSCSMAFGIRTATESGSAYVQSEPLDLTSDWQRFYTTITYDADVPYADAIITSFFSVDNCTAILDDVQLEEGTAFSQYAEYGSVNKVTLNQNRLSCTPEEAGCTLYSSATEQIPGVATAQDSCPQEAVGCKAFEEVAVTNNGADPNVTFRTGRRCSGDQSISCSTDADCQADGDHGACVPSVSLVPSSGQTCAAASVGCEEYTNLDEVAKGGEGKEYYTYIRQCAKPPANEQTYYTWLGDDQSGFQLQAYVLQKDDGAINGEDSGGPAYQAGTDTSLCTEALFNNPDDPNWTPDCRQFYDASLHVYYRLYSRTITVSDDCHPLRNTLDGQVYNAIPKEGTACPATEVQCREYRGPSGYNVRRLLDDDFDDGDALGWDGGVTSTESIIYGGYSMAVDGGSAATNSDYDLPSQLQQGRTYLVSFWAAAKDAGTNGQRVKATLGGDQATVFAGDARLAWDANASPAGPLWKQYKLGPFTLDRPPQSTDHFTISSDGGPFYLDTLTFDEVSDSIYRIKGSYALCTGNENCDRYTNPEGAVSYLKSFTRLCSTDHVGCEPLINTESSDSPFADSFENGVNADGSSPKTTPADHVDFVVNDGKFACQPEYAGCKQAGQPTLGPGGFFCDNDPTVKCTEAASEEDCGAPGLCSYHEVGIAKYTSTYLVDDPDAYATSLCKPEEVGCEQWQSVVTNETVYFRRPDPRVCEYKTLTLGGETVSGWYKVGTSGLRPEDVCPVANPSFYGSCDDGARCQTDTDCGTGSCNFQGYAPLASYTQPAGVCQNDPNKLRKCQTNADCVVGGVNQGPCVRWAGVCPVEQSGCKEYRDTNDPAVSVCSNNPLQRCQQDAECGEGGRCEQRGCRPQCLYTVDENGHQTAVDATCAVADGRCSVSTSQHCLDDSQCPKGEVCNALGPGGTQVGPIQAGCRGYWYLQQTLESPGDCNNTVNEETGCHQFFIPGST